MAGLAGHTIKNQNDKLYAIILGYENSPILAVCLELDEDYPYLFIDKFKNSEFMASICTTTFKEAYQLYKDKLKEELEKEL